MPFCPLGYLRAQREAILTDPVVNSVAAAHDASAAQVALAWLLAIAPNVLLIPGTRSCGHLAENLAAGGLWLGDREIALLNKEFSCAVSSTRRAQSIAHAKPIEPQAINRHDD